MLVASRRCTSEVGKGGEWSRVAPRKPWPPLRAQTLPLSLTVTHQAVIPGTRAILVFVLLSGACCRTNILCNVLLLSCCEVWFAIVVVSVSIYMYCAARSLLVSYVSGFCVGERCVIKRHWAGQWVHPIWDLRRPRQRATELGGTDKQAKENGDSCHDFTALFPWS